MHKCHHRDKSMWGCGTAEQGHPPYMGGSGKKVCLKEMTSKLEPEGYPGMSEWLGRVRSNLGIEHL